MDKNIIIPISGLENVEDPEDMADKLASSMAEADSFVIVTLKQIASGQLRSEVFFDFEQLEVDQRTAAKAAIAAIENLLLYLE